jgi:hypothetical protein
VGKAERWVKKEIKNWNELELIRVLDWMFDK